MTRFDLPRTLSCQREEGSSIVETLLALGLVALVTVIGVQLIVFEQTDTIALAAAQAGSEAAAAGGADAGSAAAASVLAAGGGLGGGLQVAIAQQAGLLTASVRGVAPSMFTAGIVLPAIAVSASAPQEGYTAQEAGH